MLVNLVNEKGDLILTVIISFAYLSYNSATSNNITGVFTNSYLAPLEYNLNDIDYLICCKTNERLASNNLTETEKINESTNYLSIYPNPSNANAAFTIHVNTTEAGYITITDIVGKKIYNMQANQGVNTLQVTKNELSISAGMYIVSLQLKTKTLTQKLIIN